MDKTTVGYKLKVLREQTNYSIEEIAYKCEVSTAEYQEIENGKRYPSDASLHVLCGLYQVSRMDLEKRQFINHEQRKSIINYTQIVLSVLMLFAFALPFRIDDSIPNTSTRFLTGIDIVNEKDNVVVFWIMLALMIQVILHFLLYTNLKKYSNAFKTLFLFITFGSLTLMFAIFINEQYVYLTMFVFILLFVLHLIVTLYDLITYPVEHDFIQDKGNARYLFVLFANVVYGLIYIFVLYDAFGNSANSTIGIFHILLVLWGLYHLCFLMIRKTVLKTRKVSTIMIVIPPVVVFIFYVISMWGYSFWDNDIMFFIFLMLLPAFVMNADYFISISKETMNRYKDERES